MAETLKKEIVNPVTESTNSTTSTPKESIMKPVQKKTTPRKAGKKAAKKPAAKKTQVVIEEPKLSWIKPFILPKEVVKLTDRKKGASSMEYAVQKMIVQGYDHETMVKIFTINPKFTGQNVLWILKRVRKYYVQERNHMLRGCIVEDLHKQFQTTINRRVSAKKAAAKKAAKKVNK